VAGSPSKTTTRAAAVAWDLEIQSVGDVKGYFGRVKGSELDIGVLKKVWQLLRNESLT
jgi:hypothetical protein